MSPALALDANAIEAARIINEKITPYVAESGKSFITGGLSMDKDWNSYLLELRRSAATKPWKTSGMRPGSNRSAEAAVAVGLLGARTSTRPKSLGANFSTHELHRKKHHAASCQPEPFRVLVGACLVAIFRMELVED